MTSRILRKRCPTNQGGRGDEFERSRADDPLKAMKPPPAFPLAKDSTVPNSGLFGVVLPRLVRLFVVLVLPSCAIDPITDVQRFRKTGTDEFPGLEPNGFYRRSEVISLGYIWRDGEWVAPWRLEREADDKANKQI